MKAKLIHGSFFSLLTKYMLILGLLIHLGPMELNSNDQDITIEIPDDTSGGDEIDNDEKELFWSDERSVEHAASIGFDRISLELEMKPTPYFCEIPSPPPDMF